MKIQEKLWKFAVKYGWLVTLGIALGLYFVELKKNSGQLNVLWILRFWAEMIVVCSTLLIFEIVIYILITGAVKGVHNIKHCDIPTFEELDRYRRHYGNQSKAVKRTIEMINLYYKKNGKIDQEFVKPLDLQSLYIRYDFLEKDIEFGNDVKTVVITLVMAIIYSILQTGFTYAQSNNQKIEIQGSLIMFIVPFLILLIFVFGRIYKGQFNSFFHYVSKYEMELLTKKINKVESKIKIKEDQEAVKKMQYWLMHSLYKYKDKKVKKKNEKMKIERDIKEIANLDLCKNVPKHTVMIPVDKNGEYKYYYMEKFSGPEIDSDVVFKSDQYKYYKIYSKYKEILEIE